MSDIMLCLGERNNRGMSYIGYIFMYLICCIFLRVWLGGSLGLGFLFVCVLKDFKKLHPGEAHGWVDGQTQPRANLQVAAAEPYEGMVSMATPQMLLVLRGFFFPPSLLSASPWLMSCANRY